MPDPSQPRDRGARRAEGPDATIVIVNYRTPELVERCVQSVRATSDGLRLETVVLDNASGDGSAERLRAALPEARLVELPANRGFAAGVNAGFRASHAAIVIVLNPDTEVRPGALRALVEGLRAQPRTGVAAPLLENADGEIAPNGYRRFPGLLTLALDLCVPAGYAFVHAPALHPYALSPAALRAGRAPAWVSGAAMALRRDAYEQAGPLDEDFFLYFEETEWQQRVVRAGWAIAVVPAARVSHLMRGGGEDALVHSPYFVTSALRYLRMRGVPVAFSRVVLSLSLALSWVTLRAIACLPAKRGRALGQARAYRSLLWRTLTGLVAP
ncbi:MAG TPA: glycosyltransferase family 2 protein [Solirubrobacteraceae bacterium]|jgi:N-acetylglucosaminyl-diphospho-decaprenol L-rhamnosyltransferase|nr:glycosyltransferase family 2 protein [Solirubrobacteraceae bacterium]